MRLDAKEPEPWPLDQSLQSATMRVRRHWRWHLTMVPSTTRHGELIADLASKELGAGRIADDGHLKVGDRKSDRVVWSLDFRRWSWWGSGRASKLLLMTSACVRSAVPPNAYQALKGALSGLAVSGISAAGAAKLASFAWKFSSTSWASAAVSLFFSK